jgi:hypothetical protein
MLFYKHSYMNIHPDQHIFERLTRLDLKIHKVGHQECIAVDINIAFH